MDASSSNSVELIQLSGKRRTNFFDLAAELRNEIYTLALEEEKKAYEPSKSSEPYDLDFMGLEKTRIPTICQTSRQTRAETLPMLGIVFGDWLPSFYISAPGQPASDISTRFEEWANIFGYMVVPHLRWFLLGTRNVTLIVVLEGSQAERDEIMESADFDCTPSRGQEPDLGVCGIDEHPISINCEPSEIDEFFDMQLSWMRMELGQLLDNNKAKRLNAESFLCFGETMALILEDREDLLQLIKRRGDYQEDEMVD